MVEEEGGGGEGVKALFPSGSCATPARAQTCGSTRTELRARRHSSRALPTCMAVPARAEQGQRAKLHINFSRLS